MTNLVRLIILFLIVLGIVSFIRSIAAPSDTRRRSPRPDRKPGARTGKLFKDPVCGTYVTADGSPKSEREGETVYFCSNDCLEKFQTLAR